MRHLGALLAFLTAVLTTFALYRGVPFLLVALAWVVFVLAVVLVPRVRARQRSKTEHDFTEHDFTDRDS